jgi:hypothetical protein
VQTQEELEDRLIADAEDLATELVEGFGIAHRRQSGPHSALLRWSDFRLRHVEARPREVRVSNQFSKSVESLDDKTIEALRALATSIARGGNINRFQSRGLLMNDSSGKSRGQRTDHLWADWGIHHLHVTKEMVDGTYFSARSDFLLFVWFLRDFALLLDVQPHSGIKYQFSQEKLIRLAAQNWPEVLEQFLMPRTGVLEREHTDEERQTLRRGGINLALAIDGKLYQPPGLGITSAATPIIVTEHVDKVRQSLRKIAHEILNPAGQFLTHVPESRRAHSHFSLILSADGVVIHEKETNHGWTLPDVPTEGYISPYAIVADALTPPWVRKAMAEIIAASAA